MEFGICLFAVVETQEDIREYLGIGYIKSYLNSKGLACDAKVICKAQMEEVLCSFEQFPKLIGISLYCDNQGLVKWFCQMIKQKSPSCHIVLGGPQVMEYEQDILERMPLVDSVCTGEGEVSIYQLACRLMNGEVLYNCDGITFRDNNSIVQNARRADIENLDALALPYRERNELNKKRYFYIMGSRGCLGRCAFCAEYKTGGACVRIRSAIGIVDEMEALVKQYGIHKFHFTDPTFEDPGRIGAQRAEAIFKEILRRKLRVRLILYTRVNIVNRMDDSYYTLAYEAGVESFFIGVESGNEEDLKRYVKGAKPEDSLRAVKKLMEHNIYPSFGFICFNPYSTYNSLQENLDFLHKSGLIYNSHQILSRLEIMPQALMKDRLIADHLLDEFHFDSDVYSYRYENPDIEKLYFLLCDAIDTSHLIDYDTQISIDQIYYRKSEPDLYQNELEPLFCRMNAIRMERNEYLYNFFTKAVQLHKNEGPSDAFIKHINLNEIHVYDKKIKKLFYKYTAVYIKQKGAYNAKR